MPKKSSPQILIIGSGSLGFATGISLLKTGLNVWFDDINYKIKNRLSQIGYKVFNKKSNDRKFDYIYICVPTPTINNQMSTKFLIQAIKKTISLINNLSKNSVVIVRSTILPGTMDNVVIPLLRKNIVHKQYGICYYPSFMREKRGWQDEDKPWISVIAYDKKITKQKMALVFIKSSKTNHEANFQEAELIKYGSNLYNAAKVSYFNQMFLYSKALKINGRKIIKAIAEAAEGNWNPFYGTKPGFPFGGKCLPKDLAAFTHFVRKTKIGNITLLKAIKIINTSVQNKNVIRIRQKKVKELARSWKH